MFARLFVAFVALIAVSPASAGILVDHDKGTQAKDLRPRDEVAKQDNQAAQNGQTPNAQDLQAMWASQAQDMAKAGKAAPNDQQLQALEEEQQAQAAKQGQQAPTAEQLHAIQQIGQTKAEDQAHAAEALEQTVQAKGGKQDLPFGFGNIFGGGSSGGNTPMPAMAGAGTGFDIGSIFGGGGGKGTMPMMGAGGSPFDLGGIFKNLPMPMSGGSSGSSANPFDVGGIFKGLFPNGIDLSKLPQPKAADPAPACSGWWCPPKKDDDCPAWWPYCPKPADDCPAWLPKWYCPKKPDDCPYPWFPWYCPKKPEKSWYGYDCPSTKPKCPSCYGGWNGEKFVCFYFWVAGCECEY